MPSNSINKNVTDWLKARNNFTTTLIICTLAIMIYGCMYGIRKPFTAAESKRITLWNTTAVPGIETTSVFI